MKNPHRWLIVLAFLSVVGNFANAQTAAWNENRMGWNAPTTCTSGQPVSNCPVTGYVVERSATTSGTFAQVGTTGAAVTAFAHTGAVAGQNCYRVLATSAQGNSGPSNVFCFTNTEPSGPPSPPTNLRAVSTVAYNVRPDYSRFVFVRGSRAGTVKLGASCDADRATADGYYAIDRRNMVTPRPAEGVVVVARCA